MDASQTFIANLAILNTQLRKEVEHNLFWSKFTGDVKITRRENGQTDYQPSGKIIEQFNEPVAAGRDNILIPFLNSLTGAPVFGDTLLKGTGEDMSLKWLRSYVNQFRKAVFARSGQMAEQRAKLLKMYEKAKPLLVDWWVKYHNQEIFRAFYEGVSQNLSASTASDGLGLYKRYHPNFYYQSADGTLTALGTAGYTKSTTNIDDAATNVDTHEMTAKTLEALRILCLNLKIPQLTTASGFKFWTLLVHPSSMKNLRADSTFTGAQNAAFTGKALKNPILNAADAFFAGFAIFEDILGVRGWDATNNDFMGSSISEELDPTDVTANTCSIVLGSSAMGKAVGQKLHFTKEIDDHENTVEIGGAEISGYNRADFTAEADAAESSGDLFRKNTTGGVASGIAVTNQSSLILMTDEY